jgi:hypothetical protein
VIGFNNGGEDWEAVFGVEGSIEIIAVNASDFLYPLMIMV